MGINELFDGIARVVERFTEEIAEQKLQEKVSRTGRGPKVRSEKTEKEGVKEKAIYPDFPKIELWRVLNIRGVFLQKLDRMDFLGIFQSPAPSPDQ